MILNDLGHTGLRVSALGFGAMHINDERTTEAEAGALLHHVLDSCADVAKMISTVSGTHSGFQSFPRHSEQPQRFIIDVTNGDRRR